MKNYSLNWRTEPYLCLPVRAAGQHFGKKFVCLIGQLRDRGFNEKATRNFPNRNLWGKNLPSHDTFLSARILQMQLHAWLTSLGWIFCFHFSQSDRVLPILSALQLFLGREQWFYRTESAKTNWVSSFFLSLDSMHSDPGGFTHFDEVFPSTQYSLRTYYTKKHERSFFTWAAEKKMH